MTGLTKIAGGVQLKKATVFADNIGDAYVLRRRQGYYYRWDIGNQGTTYGYESPATGNIGGLFPLQHNGITITDFIVTTADVVVLQTEANVPLYGTSSIVVSVYGAPSPSYQINPVGPGVGLYQTTIPELAQFVIARYPGILGFNLGEA